MFADYQALVLRSYQEQKAANGLSLNLMHSSSAKLRNECEAVINKRYAKKDEKALSAFFGEQEDATGYLRAIRKSEADQYKPLHNFLRGNTRNTDEKNIELLAWLINFEQRPYRVNQDFTIAEGEMPSVWKEKIVKKDAGPVVLDGHKANRREKKFKISKPMIFLILVVLLLVSVAAGYQVWNSRIAAGEQAGCMYWISDHYQPVSCSQKITNATVLALDTMKLVRFRKITRPDTITSGSLGKVWYSKINNNIEFFTAGGFHPVHMEKRLKPVTVYMINKYATNR